MADGGGVSVEAVVRNLKEITTAIKKVDVAVDVATLAALKTFQSTAKKEVRSRLRGAPRWSRRGRSSVWPDGFNSGRTPVHIPRSGGPGRLSGMLYRGVGSVRPKADGLGGWRGGVGVGKSANNIHKKKTEAKYPFFAPGIDSALKKGRPIFEAAWAKALAKTR